MKTVLMILTVFLSVQSALAKTATCDIYVKYVIDPKKPINDSNTWQATLAEVKTPIQFVGPEITVYNRPDGRTISVYRFVSTVKIKAPGVQLYAEYAFKAIGEMGTEFMQTDEYKNYVRNAMADEKYWQWSVSMKDEASGIKMRAYDDRFVASVEYAPVRFKHNLVINPKLTIPASSVLEIIGQCRVAN